MYIINVIIILLALQFKIEFLLHCNKRAIYTPVGRIAHWQILDSLQILNIVSVYSKINSLSMKEIQNLHLLETHTIGIFNKESAS